MIIGFIVVAILSGGNITCSINYSKQLPGPRFFFGLSQEVVRKDFRYPDTALGDFILLCCGSSRNVLVLPRKLILEMLERVSTRKLDVFLQDGSYILQTTRHPKANVTAYLNEFPSVGHKEDSSEAKENEIPGSNRVHAKYQSALIDLGRAEGCSVWVPQMTEVCRSRESHFIDRTVERLPNFGFDENTRRIVQNIDALWLTRNVIRSAFEVEASTTIYSGLPRLNDLVLAQPNNQIALYVIASKGKRLKVFNQLLRHSFHPLIPQCEFLPFKELDDQMEKIERIPVDRGARVTGLLKGERFFNCRIIMYIRAGFNGSLKPAPLEELNRRQVCYQSCLGSKSWKARQTERNSANFTAADIVASPLRLRASGMVAAAIIQCFVGAAFVEVLFWVLREHHPPSV